MWFRDDSGGNTNFGIFPTLGQQVQGQQSDTIATVIDSGTTHIDVINLTGTFLCIQEAFKINVAQCDLQQG